MSICPALSNPRSAGLFFFSVFKKWIFGEGSLRPCAPPFFRLAPSSLDQRRAAPPRAAAAVKSALDSPELECVSDAAAEHGDGDAPLTLYTRRRRSLSLDSALIVHRPLSPFSPVL